MPAAPKAPPKPELPAVSPEPQQEMFKQLTQLPISAVLTDQAAFNLIEKWAKKYAASNIVPKAFQNNEANCAIAINIALRLHMDPIMIMQSGYVVYGQWAWLAVFYIACINTSEKFVPGSFNYVTGGEGLKSWCKATAVSRLTGKIVEGSMVSLEMARDEGWSTKPGSKWKTMPDHMLRFRAAAFFGKEHVSEKTLGMPMVEELHDIYDVDPKTGELKTGVEGAKEMLSQASG